MTGFRLEPLDTLFFRDGTPFTADSAPQDGVGTLFPPHPPTVAGAVRAALARANGWDGLGRWPAHVSRVLGDGWDDTGEISVGGPFLLYDDEPLFPVPRHLLGTTDATGWRPRTLLRPGPETVCDLGNAVRLPAVPPSTEDALSLAASDGHWLTRAGLESVLSGRCPPADEVVESRALWCAEPRIGLKREERTRTAQESMLYSSTHVRMTHGRPLSRHSSQRGNVSLGVSVSGIPKSWKLPLGDLVPLGGESRLVECRRWCGAASVPVPRAQVVGSGRLAVIVLSPLDLDLTVDGSAPPLAVPGGGQVTVVSACLDRPLRIGGWDSLNRQPQPLRSVLAPGSVLFCEVAEPQRLLAASTGPTGLPSLGRRQGLGFGMVAIGLWPPVGSEAM